MSHTGEFDLIERISAQFGAVPGVTGIGDDCAIIPQKEGLDTLVTTDLLIEDRHFLLPDISPEDLGWKSAAVNISDIAAMGGRPESAFLSIALPKSVGVEWVDGFIHGFKELSSRFGVTLLGGDTSASPDKLFINVTVLGSCAHGAARRRSEARPGDLVCVTGPLGDSAGGLKLVLERSARGVSAGGVRGRGLWLPKREGARLREGAPAPDPACGNAVADTESELIRRHYRPVPRVAEGLRLAAASGVHAMMDISDGIASDLRHILKASSGRRDGDFAPLCAEIDLGSVPLSDELRSVCAARGWDPFELAVSGGEDYELLFTMAPGTVPPVPFYPIGRILPAPLSSPGCGEIRWLGGSKADYKGFTHF